MRKEDSGPQTLGAEIDRHSRGGSRTTPPLLTPSTHAFNQHLPFQQAHVVTVRRDISQCAEEGVLINDDLNALPPQQKCPIFPPSALGERRGSTFVAASEPHNDDVTPVMRVSTTTHRTHDSEQIAPMRG